jgi:hypothetical protein
MTPQSAESPQATTWKKRLQGFLFGSLFIAMGYWLIGHGVHVVTGRYRVPVFSNALVAGGIVLVLASAAPSWLILRATALKKYRPYKANSIASRKVH